MTPGTSNIHEESRNKVGFWEGLTEYLNSIWQELKDPIRAIVVNLILTLLIIASSWIILQAIVFFSTTELLDISIAELFREPIVRQLIFGLEILSLVGTGFYFLIDTIVTVSGKFRQLQRLKKVYKDVSDVVQQDESVESEETEQNSE